MSSREFTEWVAYSTLEPFGEMQADLRAAIVASIVANANRDPAKQPEPFQPNDFFPSLPRAKRRRAGWQAMFAKMKMIGESLKGQRGVHR